MKKCKHCKSEMDANAKICPNCRKKQGMPIWLIVIIVVVIIGVIGSLASGNSSDEDTQTSSSTSNTTTTTEKVSLMDGHSGEADSSYSYSITGTLKNNTDTDYSYVQVEFYAYDAEGNLLDTCLANNNGLEANGTWKFTASCFFADGNSSDVASYKLKEITQW